MIQALIAQHFRDKESKTGRTEQVDIVKGKGNSETSGNSPPDADIDLRKGFDLTFTRRPRCREDINSRLVQTIHYLRLYRSRHMLTVVSKIEGVAELFRKPLFQITCGK